MKIVLLVCYFHFSSLLITYFFECVKRKWTKKNFHLIKLTSHKTQIILKIKSYYHNCNKLKIFHYTHFSWIIYYFNLYIFLFLLFFIHIFFHYSFICFFHFFLNIFCLTTTKWIKKKNIKLKWRKTLLLLLSMYIFILLFFIVVGWLNVISALFFIGIFLVKLSWCGYYNDIAKK